jgi:hypothetical protein
MNPSYNRQAALAYARKYWNRACSDGYVGMEKEASGKNYAEISGWVFKPNLNALGGNILGPRFETAYSPDYSQHLEWEMLFDCAHFLSCCIGRETREQGGGISLKPDFPRGPYGILGAGRLVQYLKGANIASIAGPERHRERSRIADLSAGDIVAYWKPTDARRPGHYAHTALYMGNGMIACHTYSRCDTDDCTWDKQWDLRGGDKPEYEWTLLRMPAR